MSNFAGLEALNKRMEGDAPAMADGDVMEMAELIAYDFEATLAMEDLTGVLSDLEIYEQSYAAIERLHDIIDRDGISRGLMEFADPNRELEVMPGFPALESLDMVEGFKDTMKKWVENIKKFFKMVWEKIQKAFGAVVQLFSKYETTLKKLAEKLKNVSGLDDEKIKKEISCVEKGKLDRLSEVILEVQGNLTKTPVLKADELKMLGLKRKEEEKDGKKITTYESEDTDRKAKKQSLKDHGFDAKWCQNSVDVAIMICSKLRSSKVELKAIEAERKSAETELKSLEKATGETDDTKAKKENVKNIVNRTNNIVKLYTNVAKYSKEYIANVITASNAVIAAKK
jgi:hypothetical protein